MKKITLFLSIFLLLSWCYGIIAQGNSPFAGFTKQLDDKSAVKSKALKSAKYKSLSETCKSAGGTPIESAATSVSVKKPKDNSNLDITVIPNKYGEPDTNEKTVIVGIIVFNKGNTEKTTSIRVNVKKDGTVTGYLVGDDLTGIIEGSSTKEGNNFVYAITAHKIHPNYAPAKVKENKSVILQKDKWDGQLYLILPIHLSPDFCGLMIMC